jgi:transposase
MLEKTIEPNGGMGHASAGSGNKLPPRRQYTLELKRRIVEETFVPGASVSIVARRHNINSNLVFTWRRRYREGTLGASTTALKAAASPAQELIRIGVIEAGDGLRPLRVGSNSSTLSPATPRPKTASVPRDYSASGGGLIEIELPNRVKLRVASNVEEASLRLVLAVTRQPQEFAGGSAALLPVTLGCSDPLHHRRSA